MPLSRWARRQASSRAPGAPAPAQALEQARERFELFGKRAAIGGSQGRELVFEQRGGIARVRIRHGSILAAAQALG